MAHRHFVQLTLLGYLLVVLGVLTLSPFRFAWPAEWVVSWWGDSGDMPRNFLLFLPIGFVFRLLLRQDFRGAVVVPLLSGCVLSLAIEISQLFLEERLTSLLDLISNTLGAAAGAALCGALRARLDRRLQGVLTLDLPLINILYLLLPLMWLAGTGLGSRHVRLWVLLPLGVMGALTLAGMWRFRLHRALHRPRTQLVLIVCAWFAIGAIVGLREAPALVATCAGVVVLLGAVPACVKGPCHGGEHRFEGRVLAVLWPCYLSYLFMITADFPPRLDGSFDSAWIYPEYGFHRDFALRVVEQLGALTLLGYLIGESCGRSSRTPRYVLLRSLLLGAACAAAIEAAHGFHVDERASLLRGALGVTAAWFGMALYAAQLDLVRFLIQAPRAGDPRPSGARA